MELKKFYLDSVPRMHKTVNIFQHHVTLAFMDKMIISHFGTVFYYITTRAQRILKADKNNPK